MNNLQKYFEYEKDNLNLCSQDDFLRVLNNIETKKGNKTLNNNKEVNFIKSPFVGWSIGFVGLSLAVYTFFFIPSNTQISPVAVISPNDVATLKEKSQKTVEIINSINSFESLKEEN